MLSWVGDDDCLNMMTSSTKLSPISDESSSSMIEVVLLTILSNDSARIPRVGEASASAFVGFTIVATIATTVRMVEKRVMIIMEEVRRLGVISWRCYWVFSCIITLLRGTLLVGRAANSVSCADKIF